MGNKCCGFDSETVLETLEISAPQRETCSEQQFGCRRTNPSHRTILTEGSSRSTTHSGNLGEEKAQELNPFRTFSDPQSTGLCTTPVASPCGVVGCGSSVRPIPIGHALSLFDSGYGLGSSNAWNFSEHLVGSSTLQDSIGEGTATEPPTALGRVAVAAIAENAFDEVGCAAEIASTPGTSSHLLETPSSSSIGATTDAIGSYALPPDTGGWTGCPFSDNSNDMILGTSDSVSYFQQLDPFAAENVSERRVEDLSNAANMSAVFGVDTSLIGPAGESGTADALCWNRLDTTNTNTNTSDPTLETWNITQPTPESSFWAGSSANFGGMEVFTSSAGASSLLGGE